MKHPVAWISIALGACVSLAVAQPARNAAERASDHRQLRQDHRERRDDARDHARVASLVGRFDAARAAHDVGALQAIDAEVHRLLAAESAEGRHELARDKAEVRQSSRELRASRREVRRDRRQDRPDHEIRDDRRDRRDDRRDRRDDVRDARVEAASQQALHRIAAGWRELHGRYDAASLDRKRALLAELARLSAAERARNREEIREDRRELREDRRETREDRRQGGH